MPFPYFPALVLLLFMIGEMACASRTNTHSLLFQEVFRGTEGMFRGINLGEPLPTVKQKEPQAPQHDDILGLTYYYPLPDSQQLFVEYFAGLPDEGRRGDSLQAISANVFLQDEITAAELYGEIREHLRTQMGISLGVYGADVWESEGTYGGMEARLLFNEGEKDSASILLKKGNL